MRSAGATVYAVYSDKDCAQWTGNLEDVTTKSDHAAENTCYVFIDQQGTQPHDNYDPIN